MAVTFLVCAAVSGWCTPGRLAEFRHLRNYALVQRAMQGWLSDQARFAEQQVGLVRRRVAFARWDIEMLEWKLRELSADFPPEVLDQWRQDREVALAELQRWQQVLEWVEEQRRLKPGPKTEAVIRDRLMQLHEELFRPKAIAPAPRPVKR